MNQLTQRLSQYLERGHYVETVEGVLLVPMWIPSTRSAIPHLERIYHELSSWPVDPRRAADQAIQQLPQFRHSLGQAIDIINDIPQGVIWTLGNTEDRAYRGKYRGTIISNFANQPNELWRPE